MFLCIKIGYCFIFISDNVKFVFFGLGIGGCSVGRIVFLWFVLKWSWDFVRYCIDIIWSGIWYVRWGM